eukprot:scpid19880/ scgid13963/ Protein MMS22-like; Methyl methanesulfonate-sensitivity protein 22-like
MLSKGPKAKRPRITDEDEWPEAIPDDEQQSPVKELVCFKCCLAAAATSSKSRRQGRNDISGGYLAGGMVKRLLSSSREPVFPGLDTSPTRILGMQVASTSGLAQQLMPLFRLARRMSDILMTPHVCKEWMKVNAPEGEVSTLRLQVVEFLAFVCSTLERLARSSSENCPQSPMQLITTIHQQLLVMHADLRKRLEPLFAGAASSISLQNVQGDGLPFIFHLWLDVGWALMANLVTLSKLEVDGYLPDAPGQLLTHHCLAQVADLLHLQCSAMEKTWPDVNMSDLMPCTCILEVWQTLRLVLDWSSELVNTMSFWSLVNSSLRDLASSSPASDDASDNEAKSPLYHWQQRCDTGQRRSFCWLLLASLSELYHFDELGVYVQQPARTYSNWIFVQDLLRLSIDKNATPATADDRINIRFLLTSLLSLADAWPASQDILLLLWDVMHRFLTTGVSRDPNQSQPSVTGWIQQCEEACNASVKLTASPSGELWWLFLRVLAVKLRKPQAGVSMWMLVKGRFLSRFNRRRMQELSWIGLENFCSLFFVLALCSDTNDIVSKMLPLLETVPLSDVSCQLVCWRGLLAVHVLCQQKRLPVDRVQKSLSGRFSMILKSCLASGSPEQFAVLNHALDCLEELHDNNYLRSSLHHFLGPDWATLLVEPKRRERECCRLLEACVWFVEVVRSSSLLASSEEGSEGSSENAGGLCSALWQFVYPSLCQLSYHQHLSTHLGHQVADVCMVFAQLSYLFPVTEAKGQTFQGIVEQFGFSERVPVGIRLRFLSHLVSDSDTHQLLLSEGKSTITMLFHCWVTAIVSCSGSTSVDQKTRDQLVEFTRAMEKLPDIQQILQLPDPLDMPDPIDTSHMPMWEASLQTFIRSIGIAYRSPENAEKRSQYKTQANRYFSAILPLAEGHILAEKASPALKCIYRILGCVVQWCSTLLYSRTSHQCLLPPLLDKLVVPLSTTKKPVPTALDSCIRRHAYQFFFGIACLDFARDDYVRRKLREVVQRNILVPSPSLNNYGGITTSHPYLLALLSLRSVIGDADVKAIRQLMLCALRDHFLIVPTKQPNLFQAAVTLINCLHQISGLDAILSDCPTLLCRLLSCLLACEVGRAGNDARTVKPLVEGLLKNMLSKVEIAGKSDRHSIVQLLSTYATENIRQQKHYTLRPLVALAPTFPKLMAEFCPFAEGIVQQFETAQGKGNDLQLRSVLQQLQKACQGHRQFP